MTINSYPRLLNVKDEIDKCTRCASCQAGCPTYELTEAETLAARGRVRIAQALLSDQITLTNRVKNDFSQCLTCMSCLTACPAGVDTIAIFDAVRTEINDVDGQGLLARVIFKYFLPYPWRLNLLAKIVGFSTLFYKAAPSFLTSLFPFSQNGVKRVTPNFLKRNLRSTLKEVNRSGSDAAPVKRVIFFSGCMTDLAFSETGKSVVKLLNKMNVEVIFPKEQLCCGAPPYFSGDIETAKSLAKKNIEVLSGYDADAIVYSCATCGSVLGETYPHLFPDDARVKALALKTVDFQKFLIELSVGSLSEDLNKSDRKLKVTYHDPCHLRRGMGVKSEPRQLIKSLPNVEFVEMEGADSCCGGSGTFSLKHYDMSIDQGKRKAEWIKESGADIVVTACPSCQLQLADSVNRSGLSTPVLHTADLITSLLDKSGSKK